MVAIEVEEAHDGGQRACERARSEVVNRNSGLEEWV